MNGLIKNDETNEIDGVDEDILSPELREQLGGSDVDNLVMPSSKTKRKKEDTVVVSADNMAEARKLTKRARKREDYLKKVAERESKKAQFLDTLAQHQISSLHQELLTSSRDIGQTLTTKQHLNKIHKKYKAGFELSPEEMELLFPGSNSALSVENEFVESAPLVNAVPTIPSSTALPASSNLGLSSDSNNMTNNGSAQDNNNNSVEIDLFGFNDFSSMPQISRKQEKKSKSTSIQKSVDKEKEQLNQISVPVDIEKEQSKKTSVPSMGSSGVGVNLLAQLAQLKATMSKKVSNTNNASAATVAVNESNMLANQSKKVETSSSSTVCVPDSSSSTSSSSGVAYVPTPNENPLESVTGRIKTKVSSKEVPAKHHSLSKAIVVNRDESIQASRMELPVCGMEQEIMEQLSRNDVVILCGETGSGKSTQVPQFLYEAGWGEEGWIGITQPRRVAATSTAQRVAYEMGSACSETNPGIVGYQIRFDSSTIGSNTKIKFMTDGILLREIAEDLLLRKYRVVILDEAHERCVNTDVLLGMISRSVVLRRQQHEQERKVWESLSVEQQKEYQKPISPLTLVIMSATLRVEDFCQSNLFPQQLPPVIKVEARQYPVTTHFSRRTELNNYLREAHRKVCQIHRKLPTGGILLFLTGKMEVLTMCRKLNQSLAHRRSSEILMDVQEEDAKEKKQQQRSSMVSNEGFDSLFSENLDGDEKLDPAMMDDDDSDWEDPISNSHGHEDDDSDNQSELSDIDEEENICWNEMIKKEEQKQQILEQQQQKNSFPEAMELRQRMLQEAVGNIESNEALSEEKKTKKNLKDKEGSEGSSLSSSNAQDESLRPWILPLFAMMSQKQQQLVFQSPPPGHRLIVVATDVAETSITIPNIRYVVDCGRHKEKVYSNHSGISKYEVKWVSKASADQRKGRAGRTGPGHVYRLYSSAFFDQYFNQFQPPEILSTPLEDLVLQMRSMGIHDIEHFPFPTPPPKSSISQAIKLLFWLGALFRPKVSNAITNSVSNFLSRDLEGLSSSSSAQKTTAQQLQELGAVSSLGKLLAQFPLSPRFSKILIMAKEDDVVSVAVNLVSILADKSPFDSFVVDQMDSLNSSSKDEQNEDEMQIEDDDDDDDVNESANGKKSIDKKDKDIRKALRIHPRGDALARLQAFGAYGYFVSNYWKQQLLAANSGSKAKVRAKMRQTKSENSNGAGSSRKEMEDFDRKEDAFCRQMGIVQSVMRKAWDLRKQLVVLCEKVLQVKIGDENCWNPPTASEEVKLSKLLLMAFPDQLTRKTLGVHVSRNMSRKDRYMSYRRGYPFSDFRSFNTLDDPSKMELLYIHPHSNQYSPSQDGQSLPEYVVYGSLIRNDSNRYTYMMPVTVIQSAWIPVALKNSSLLRWSDILEQPSPFYDPRKDKVMAFSQPSYGATNPWTFPPEKMPMLEIMDILSNQDQLFSYQANLPLGSRKQDEIYRWIARFLLEGTLLSSLKHVLNENILKINPLHITTGKAMKETSSLLAQLVRHEIINRSNLDAKILEDDTFLRNEIGSLISDSKNRSHFVMAWKQYALRLKQS